MAEQFLKNLARLGVRKPLRGGEFGFAWLAVATALVLAQNPACASRAPGPDTYGYTVAATTDFTFLQITNAGSSRVLWFNDDAPYTANLGFTFNFYGSNYTSVSFTPNGLMTFGGTNSAYSNVDLTITSLSTNLPGIAVQIGAQRGDGQVHIGVGRIGPPEGHQAVGGERDARVIRTVEIEGEPEIGGVGGVIIEPQPPRRAGISDLEKREIRRRGHSVAVRIRPGRPRRTDRKSVV